uniref:Transcriptional regulatory protein n=1 Tax=Plectus sambesii TaxID=2011161 RepID=A0A914XID0_9BILA
MLLQRYGRLIKVAVKFGGFDMKTNSRLAALQQEFKEKNLPFETFEKFMDNLKNRPEKKFWLDVIGPGGSFFIIEIETDSKTRTSNLISKLFKQLGQFRFSQDNNVRSWFESKGVVVISANRPATGDQTAPLPAITLEQAEEIAINVDCEEVTAIEDEEGNPAFEILCEANAVDQVEQQLTEMNLRVLSADVEYRAMNTLQLDENSAKLTQRFYELIEENDEVLKVFDNVDPGEDVAAAEA